MLKTSAIRVNLFFQNKNPKISIKKSQKYVVTKNNHRNSQKSNEIVGNIMKCQKKSEIVRV